MSSKNKQIGIIGEQILIAEFIKHGINVLLPIGDNSPYDIVIELNGIFYKVQVKTTEHIKNGKMIFSTNKSNPYTKINKKYTSNEIDLLGFYCIENGYIGLMSVYNCTSKDTILRVDTPKNNQFEKIKMASNYKFDNIINTL